MENLETLVQYPHPRPPDWNCSCRTFFAMSLFHEVFKNTEPRKRIFWLFRIRKVHKVENIANHLLQNLVSNLCRPQRQLLHRFSPFWDDKNSNLKLREVKTSCDLSYFEKNPPFPLKFWEGAAYTGRRELRSRASPVSELRLHVHGGSAQGYRRHDAARRRGRREQQVSTNINVNNKEALKQRFYPTANSFLWSISLHSFLTVKRKNRKCN